MNLGCAVCHDMDMTPLGASLPEPCRSDTHPPTCHVVDMGTDGVRFGMSLGSEHVPEPT